MDIYGIIRGKNEPDTFCKRIISTKNTETCFKAGNFLSFFKLNNDNIEADFNDLYNNHFNEKFLISSEFNETEIFPLGTTEKEIKNKFSEFKSLYLPMFCAAISDGLYDNVFLTGTINFKYEKACKVKDIKDKYEIVKKKIMQNSFEDKKNLFLYIADEIIDEKGKPKNLEIQQFPNNTPLSSIIFFLTHTCSFSAIREKQLFTNTTIDFIKTNQRNISIINCFFSGTKSSSAFLSNPVFDEINALIYSNTQLIINIFQLKVFSLKERTNSRLKRPDWFTEDNEDLRKKNEEMSLFDSSLTPVLMQFSDSILETGNDKIQLNLKIADNKNFLKENPEMCSCIEIISKDSSFIAISDEERISLFDKESNKNKNKIEKSSQKIKKSFLLSSNKEPNSQSNFIPMVLTGFPGIGKTSTILSLAREESKNPDEKVISTDDRINNAAFSDNPNVQIFRNQYDWFYLSRNKCKERALKMNEKEDNYMIVEYNYRSTEVQNSIALAKVLHCRIDIGAKECLNKLTRYELFKNGYQILYLTITETPLDRETIQKLHSQKADMIVLPSDEKVLFENNWNFFRQHLIEILNTNKELFNTISEHCFNDYYERIFRYNPAMADKESRRNFYEEKNIAMDNACENCNENLCTVNCSYWQNEKNQTLFKNFVHKLWNNRFEAYCKYCHKIIVRGQSLSETTKNLIDILSNK